MFSFLAAADPVGDHKVHNMAPQQSDLGATQAHSRTETTTWLSVYKKTCHSALKQLVLRESYGAEIVNSMWQWGGGGREREGQQHLSSTVSVSERLILKHTMEYLCMWMPCCHFLSDRSYQATLRWYDVMCSVYSIFQMKALWTSPYINTHYHVLTPSLSPPSRDRGNLARHSLLTQRKQIEGK